MLTFGASVLEGEFDVCVVGAGPAGMACALDCSEHGLRVLVLEAGRERPVPGEPDLLAAEIDEPKWHDPTSIVSASALGGSSHWWGGRSVPFDPWDFAAWPISYEEMAPWYEKGAAFLGARGVHETPAPGAFARLAAFDAVRDETLCPQINMSKRWGARLRAMDGPTVLLGARVVGLVAKGARIFGVRVLVGREEKVARAARIVLACGGLGGLKLLLLTQRDQPALFGGADGPLGRGYMGHLTGAIADLELSNGGDAAAFGSRRLEDGVFARRRIRSRAETAAQDGAGNIAFWLENASKENPAYGSSIGSAKYLAARVARTLSGRGGKDAAPIRPHLENVARAPIAALAGLSRTAYALATARVTGHLWAPPLTVPSGERAWQLHYHSEQRSDPANRVSLSTMRKDSTGAPALHIDFRFGAHDFERVVHAHELLDADLQQAGAGRIKWRKPRAESLDVVRAYAGDGYHQLGGAVMSKDPARGVVDPDCRAHGLENLWIVSGSVFPSGSQANPTLTIVSLARRAAAHLAGR